MLSQVIVPCLFGLASLTLTDIFVDGSSANCATGTGTAADPVCTIGSAVALASSGDTIRIAPGIYTEHLVLGFDIDLVGTDGAEVTIIDGGGSGGSVVRVLLNATVAIEGLTLTGGLAAAGGGVNSRGNLTLRNTIVSGNEARSANATGGGLASSQAGASITILNSTISDNLAVATTYSAHGGGIRVAFGSLTIRDSTIEGNEVCFVDSPGAGTGGGGIELFRATLVMSGSAVLGNVVDAEGGGINLYWSAVDISNSTLSGNTAIRGPAMASFEPALTTSRLSNVTIVNHSRGAAGGAGPIGTNAAVHFWSNPMEVQNCIISNDDPFVGATGFDVIGSSITSLGNNLFGRMGTVVISPASGDLFGTVGAEVDAVLGPLQDNGGPTQTHAILPNSPALDAANPVVFESVDQRGVARPLGIAPDMGAFELRIFSSFCSGDGGDQLGCTNCPCMNNAVPGTVGGCLNSAGTSARLIASGDPSVSLPALGVSDLRFAIKGAPPSAFCLLNSGDGVAPSNVANPCFGLRSGAQAAQFNGLRCAIMNTRRHGGRPADLNGEVGVTNNPWGGEGGPPVGIAGSGAGYVAGQTRYFQVINRDDPLLSCVLGLNTSQAVEVLFTP